MAHKINNTEIEVIKGDITLLDADAIVNPANNYKTKGAVLIKNSWGKLGRWRLRVAAVRVCA